MTKAEHRALVEKRRKDSAMWDVIHWLGSLRLAMILLATIAIACAAATFIEAEFSARVAQAYVYKAPWFIFWLGVLMINLFAVTLTRWPWQRRHTGFIITHYGIIVLLIGGVIGQKHGFEGSVRLLKGKPAHEIVDREKVIYIRTLDGMAAAPFDPELTPPSAKHPRSIKLPGSAGRIVIDDYSQQLTAVPSLMAAPGTDAPPGVAFHLTSARMGQEVPGVLMAESGANTFDLSGLAEVRFHTVLPPLAPEPPVEKMTETLVAFALAPDAPIVERTGSEQPSGYFIRLLVEQGIARLVITRPDDTELSRPIDALLGKGPVGIDGATIELLDYWPAMEVVDGKPVSKNSEPTNPAAALRLVAPKPGAPRLPPVLDLAPDTSDAGKVVYRVSRGDKITATGTVAAGEAFATGWVDWVVTLKDVQPHAAVSLQWAPAAARTPQARPGIRMRYIAADGSAGEPAWAPHGDSVYLPTGETLLRATFANRIRPLPFNLDLTGFDVPRDEGTDRPADFRATVRFNGPQAPEPVSALIRMNHPASFPPGLWGQLSGQTYKFSQAEWNPQNLDETTLQILHDPGWLLKWIGSVMICAGITILFYFTPRTPNPTSTISQPSEAQRETSVPA